MKILITNVYSWKNKGDAAIILSMIDKIKSEYKDVKFGISSIDINDRGKYCEQFFHQSILNFLNIKKSKSESIFYKTLYFSFLNLFKIKLNIFSFFSKFGLRPYFLFSAELKDKIKSYDNYDMIVACGGGYLITKSSQRRLDKFFGIDYNELFCLDFFIGSFFKKPIILYNQSIGPFISNSDFKKIKKYLLKAKLVCLREQISYSLCSKNGLKNILKTSDIAFNLQSKEVLFDYIDLNNLNIGITVRKCLTSEYQKIYEKSIASFIDSKLTENTNIRFYFMPQVIFEEWDDNDIIISNKIKSLISIKNRDNAIVLENDYSPKELKFVISKMNYFIGTRMHSNIFALSSGVKTIAIAYEPKTTGIMNDLNLSNYVINSKDVRAEKLTKLYENILKDDDYKNTLTESLVRIKKQNEFKISNYI